MALVGTLSDFDLADIIQLVDLGKKTGTVVIHGRRGTQVLEGRVHFARGKIHGAELDNLPADEAVYTLFLATEGTFEFVESSELPPRNIQVSNEIAIMEGIDRQDAWSTVEKFIPPDDAILSLVPDPPVSSGEIKLDADKWRMITLIDGRTRVGKLVQWSGLGRFRAYQILAELISAGLVARSD